MGVLERRRAESLWRIYLNRRKLFALEDLKTSLNRSEAKNINAGYLYGDKKNNIAKSL